MARKLNLGTLRDSDDVLLPPELPTTYPSGTRPIADWAHVIDTTQGVALSHTEEHVLIIEGKIREAVDTPEIPSEIAHSKVKLTPTSKKDIRDQWGGGQGGARKGR